LTTYRVAEADRRPRRQNCGVNSPISEPDEGILTSIAKSILDFDQLLALLRKGTSRAKPWQRQLISHLDGIERTSQVLRMTIVMDRDDAEVFAAVEQLCSDCRSASSAIAGTRADLSTRAALTLMADLAGGIRREMQTHESSTA